MGDFICMLLVAGLVMLASCDSYRLAGEYNEAIRVCEAELPRDQHCVITAVVAPPEATND